MRRQKVLWLLIGFLFLLMGLAEGQSVSRVTYAIKGKDTLWFDHYLPQGQANGISVIFVHGGGFTGGSPDNQKPFAEGMTKLGYNVFVIKYRLYLKGKSFGCMMPVSEKVKAIRLAVEDARDATGYVIDHARALVTDTSKLFIAGSSAGAETILNLVYNPFIKKGDHDYDLYKTFHYAGALSFSGALLDINTLYDQPPVPLLMMHGTADQLVPYATAGHHFCGVTSPGWLMMFGSYTIYRTLRKLKVPVVLYTYEGRGHEVSNFMFRRFQEMDEFMKEIVAGDHTRIAHFDIRKGAEAGSDD